ncbi:MAG: hypothetical protein ACI9LN_003894, partial [Saprospiraceae bacterium]
ENLKKELSRNILKLKKDNAAKVIADEILRMVG